MTSPLTKRVYDPPASEDGYRVLVDRLWPRGLSKEKAAVDSWLRDIAPSNELRKWYHRDPAKWDEFQRRYFLELNDRPELVDELLAKCAAGAVTLLYSSKEPEFNNANALRDYLTQRMDDLE